MGVPYPVEWEADVVMASGRPLHVRPIVPADAARLRDFHARLSEQSVYFRYFGPKPALTEEEVVHLTTVDHRTRVALVALQRDEIVGVARYEGIDDESAEVAFVVRDDLQGRGVGSILLEHLASAARERGYKRFVAETLPLNQRMIATFRESGFDVQASRVEDVVDVSFRIDPTRASRAVQASREQRAEARSVERLLTPSRIAIIGVSRRRESVGHQLLLNLVASGYAGEVVVVHPEATSIAGTRCVRRLSDIEGIVDLVIVSVAAEAVDAVVDESARLGAIGLVVLSGGFGDTGAEGHARQRALLDHCRRAGIRLIGPNALGIITTSPAMNASLVRHMPRAGDVAVFAQSGALSMSLLDRLELSGLGVSSFVSAGNRADVSGNDMLQYWESDPRTAVVALYLESIGNGRKFARLLRRVTPVKPVLMVRTGGSGLMLPTGHAAHTTELPPHAVEQLLDAAGLVVLERVDDLIDAAGLLSGRRRPAGRRLAIIGNSDAVAVLARNAAERSGLEVVSVATFARDCAPGRFTAERSRVDPAVDSVLLVYVPAIEHADDEAIAAELARIAAPAGDGPLVVRVVPAGLRRTEPGAFDDVERAIGAVAAVTRPAPVHEDAADDARDPGGPPEAEGLVGPPHPARDPGTLHGGAALALLREAGVELRLRDPEPATPGLELAITPDALFGPVLRVGVDADIARLVDDAAYRLAPLRSVREAEDALGTLRSLPAAGDVAGVGETLLRVSRLVAEESRVHDVRIRGLRRVGTHLACTAVSVEVGAPGQADERARRMTAGSAEPDPRAPRPMDGEA